jgi:aspartyl-tRNA(Asn)/glutamyl-tRNA(Gln) amidotransferase subunit C
MQLPFLSNFFLFMALTLDDVKRVAHLARIEISDESAAQVLHDLDRIFGLIEQMREVDVAGIEPMAHGQDVVLALRPDAVTECDQRTLLQSVAPQVEAGLYLVPKVIE